MHCGAQSFPRDPQPSDLDLPLPAGTDDADYMQVSVYCLKTYPLHLWKCDDGRMCHYLIL